MRGVGWEAHVTSRDPTFGPGRAPARSGVACPKNVQRQYLTCPSELVTDLSGFVSDALDESEQDENQHDQNQQAKASGRIVTPTGAVRPGWQRAYQQQDQNN